MYYIQRMNKIIKQNILTNMMFAETQFLFLFFQFSNKDNYV